MHKIKIYSIGKSREDWLLAALTEYEKRLKHHFQIEWIFLKDNEALKSSLEKEKGYYALDPVGQSYTSPEFAHFLFNALVDEGCRLVFVIGGDEGLTSEMRANARSLISISKMTFTHQMTRLILLEQIYRASEIQRGSPYHK